MTVIFWVIAALCTFIDRATKMLAEARIAAGETVDVIKIGDFRILWFSLHHNTGAAFSSFTGMTAALSVVTVVLLAVVIIFYMKSSRGKMVTLCYGMILGGGIGNLIDRIVFSRVTDFINLFPFNFIFNFADFCVVIGAILLCVWYLFFDKEAAAAHPKEAEDVGED